MTIPISPELLLRAYASGVFPMAEDADSDIVRWFDPDPRGIVPLDAVHVPRRLKKLVRQMPFTIRIDTAFAETVDRCGRAQPGRARTWLNPELVALYQELHRLGFAHSVEIWAGDRLVGGLYGVSLGGAFFGESMFSEADNASKIAFVHLVARLTHGGYTLLDTQFVTDHLKQFGATEIPRSDYHARLAVALTQPANFYCGEEEVLLAAFLNQTPHPNPLPSGEGT